MTARAKLRRDATDLLSLVKSLHGAAAEAERDGFRHMARLLDECGVEVTRAMVVASRRNVALIERAVSCLETWRALREW
jgi:hypothetical protein